MLLQVSCVGQVIGVIVADDRDIAKRAAKLVKVDYEELPAIITIEVRVDTNREDAFLPHFMVFALIATEILLNQFLWSLSACGRLLFHSSVCR